MTTRIEITCISRGDRLGTHERILNIGGTKFDGKRWTMSQEGAISGIEEGKYYFYMNRGGKLINVIVGTSASGYKYLKTFADGEEPDSLLSLPECPDLPQPAAAAPR